MCSGDPAVRPMLVCRIPPGMEQVFQPKAEQTRTTMRRREPQEEALDRLGSEARSVLAVLVMAALWPTRYPSGWVSVDEFAEAGVMLGERADRESLKAAIRRGLRRLEEHERAPEVEDRRTLARDPRYDRPRRDRDRRLSQTPGAWLEVWLLESGCWLISPQVWRRFSPAGPRSDREVTKAMAAECDEALRRARACLEWAARIMPEDVPESIRIRRVLRAIDAEDPGLANRSASTHPEAETPTSPPRAGPSTSSRPP